MSCLPSIAFHIKSLWAGILCFLWYFLMCEPISTIDLFYLTLKTILVSPYYSNILSRLEVSLTVFKLYRHLRKPIQNMMGRLTRRNGEILSCGIHPFWRIWLFNISSEFPVVTVRIEKFRILLPRSRLDKKKAIENLSM